MSHVVRRAVLVAAIGRPCPYCGAPMEGERMPSRDHIEPRRWGRTLDDPSNRVVVCHRCNSDKGSRSLKRWLRHLERSADPRVPYISTFLAGRVR